MKKLNELTLPDILSASAITCTYKKYHVMIHNGYITIRDKDGHYKTTFVEPSAELKTVKNRIKHEINDFIPWADAHTVVM